MSALPVTRGYGVLEKLLSAQRTSLAKKLISKHRKSGKLLDIGCGAYPFFLMAADFSVKYGLEKNVNDDILDRIAMSDANVSVKQFDIEKEDTLPFENNCFDVITMLAVLEHLDPEQTIKKIAEIHRVLKPGGVYIITTPAAWSDKLLRFMALLRIVSPIEIQDHKAVYTDRRVCSLLQSGGFKKENILCGYFEIFMNMWILAKKEPLGEPHI